MGATVGGWAQGLAAGLGVGRPVDVPLPWAVSVVAAPWAPNLHYAGIND